MKYGKTDNKLEDYLATLDPKRQRDGQILVELFEEVTGYLLFFGVTPLLVMGIIIISMHLVLKEIHQLWLSHRAKRSSVSTFIFLKKNVKSG